MRLPKDLVPQKAVADDLCVSLVTLWRMRHSNLPDFPEPVMFNNLVCWRKGDLTKLEEAVLRFKGRSVFERNREADKKLKRLKATSVAKPRAKPDRPPQRDLFD